MSQELRNKIYGVVTGVFGLLLILGVVDESTKEEATTILNAVLDLVPEVVGLATVLLAFIKSLPSKVTVLEIPKNVTDNVGILTTTSGDELAGPASSLPDGTPLHAA